MCHAPVTKRHPIRQPNQFSTHWCSSRADPTRGAWDISQGVNPCFALFTFLKHFDRQLSHVEATGKTRFCITCHALPVHPIAPVFRRFQPRWRRLGDVKFSAPSSRPFGWMINTEQSIALFYLVEMSIFRNSGSRPNPVPISEMCHFVLDSVLALSAIAFEHLTKLFEQ